MIHIKSPTRVDLSGGTLDLWPLYNFVGQARTINMAIDIWTSAQLSNSTNNSVEIESLDYQKKWKFSTTSEFLTSMDPQLSLFQNAILPFSLRYPDHIHQGFVLKTKSESPIGGGLGGSSSLVVSILKAFACLTSHHFSSTHELVHWAHNIEARILNTPTGTQDYYPAASGGINFIDYSVAETTQKVIDPVETPFSQNFLLVNTGKSHHSGLNNFEVLKSAVEKDQMVMSALHEIKKISDDMFSVIQNKDWGRLPHLFQREFQSRIQLTPAFSSPEIERLSNISLKNGAEAVKICGAGGGGCVLVWVDKQYRQKVIDACEKEKFQCLSAKPVSPLIN
jgi:D-glycero-alpha-D-manno-heptose-7-phosphate kinase